MKNLPGFESTYASIPTDLRFVVDHKEFNAALQQVKAKPEPLQLIVTHEHLFLQTDTESSVRRVIVDLFESSIPEHSLLCLATRADTLSGLVQNSSDVSTLTFSAAEGIAESLSPQQLFVKIESTSYTTCQTFSLYKSIEAIQPPSFGQIIAAPVIADNLRTIFPFINDRAPSPLNPGVIEISGGRLRCLSSPWYYSIEDERVAGLNLKLDAARATDVETFLRGERSECSLVVEEDHFFFVSRNAFCRGRVALPNIPEPAPEITNAQNIHSTLAAHEFAFAVHTITTQAAVASPILIQLRSKSSLELRCICQDGTAVFGCGSSEPTGVAPLFFALKEKEIKADALRKYVKHTLPGSSVTVSDADIAIVFNQATEHARHTCILLLQDQ